MNKIVLLRRIEYFHGNDKLFINVYKGKSRYYRLSIGKFNKDINNYDLNFYFYKNIPDKDIYDILDRHYTWICNALKKKKEHISVNENEMLIHGQTCSIEEFNDRFNLEIKYIEKRYYELAKIANVNDISLKFRKMKSRWGSYNKTKKLITLNKWLVSLPYDLIDYVICHELSHHYVLNHSKDFYDILKGLYPDYLTARKAIKKYSDII